MQSIAYVPGSNGAGNASLMTVQNVRSSGASDIIVNTVTGVSTKFYASMGAPHTFTDPVTGETITIISEATAVDFAGHVDSGKLVIDAIAPGYVDTRGSLVGDIVVIRPITEWANNLFNILNQSHNDDGSLKNSAITYQPNIFDHVASGAVLAGLSYGSTLTASLTAGVAWINGIRQTIAAIATRAYTASKDTYVDALYNANGTATIVYTEVANNAASPALAANSIRLGIVVTGGANIANVGSINQGQENKVLPIVSSIAYAVTDSLGNLICPRDPNRKLLGYRQIISNFNSGTVNETVIPGLTVPVIIPVGRKIKVTVWTGSGGGSTGVVILYAHNGTTIGGTQIAQSNQGSTGGNVTSLAQALTSQFSGAQSFCASVASTAGVQTVGASAIQPGFIMLELE